MAMQNIDRSRKAGRSWGRFGRVGRALLAVTFLSTPGFAGPDCYSARLPAEIVLPDGSVHPRGELRICKRSAGSDLHLVRVGGHPVGVFAGREGRRINGAELGDQVVFVFVRNPSSQLELRGYAQRKSGQYRVFHLTDSTEWVVALQTSPEPDTTDSARDFVLVASAR